MSMTWISWMILRYSEYDPLFLVGPRQLTSNLGMIPPIDQGRQLCRATQQVCAVTATGNMACWKSPALDVFEDGKT